MSITFKLVALVIIAFIVLNSLLTVIIGTISWLIGKFGWKAWVVILLLVSALGYVLYANFGELMVTILHKIQ